MTSGGRHGVVALVVLALLAVGLVAPAAAAGPTLSAVGSPFDPDGDGKRETVRIRLELPASGTATVRVHDFDGRALRTLAGSAPLSAGPHRFDWNGRDACSRTPSGLVR